MIVKNLSYKMHRIFQQVSIFKYKEYTQCAQYIFVCGMQSKALNDYKSNIACIRGNFRSKL